VSFEFLVVEKVVVVKESEDYDVLEASNIAIERTRRDSSATSCSTIEAQKGCRMQEGGAGTKSLYIPPIRPLSRIINTYLNRQAV
jgi:hypothetical protein